MARQRGRSVVDWPKAGLEAVLARIMPRPVGHWHRVRELYELLRPSLHGYLGSLGISQDHADTNLQSGQLRFLHEIGLIVFHFFQAFFGQIDHMSRFVGGERNVAPVFLGQVQVVEKRDRDVSPSE